MLESWAMWFHTNAKGHSWITDKALARFQLEHPDRYHPTIGGRQAVIILDRPYRLGSLIPARSAQRLEPLRLRDLVGWPPILSIPFLDRAHQPREGEGLLVGTKINLSSRYTGKPWLSIVGEFREYRGTSGLSGYPEVLLKCVQVTLRGHEGEPLGTLGDLEVVEIP